MSRLLLNYLKIIEYMNYSIVKLSMKILQNVQSHGMKCSMFVHLLFFFDYFIEKSFRLFENILSMNYLVFEQNQQKLYHLISNIKKHWNYLNLLSKIRIHVKSYQKKFDIKSFLLLKMVLNLMVVLFLNQLSQ